MDKLYIWDGGLHRCHLTGFVLATRPEVTWTKQFILRCYVFVVYSDNQRGLWIDNIHLQKEKIKTTHWHNKIKNFGSSLFAPEPTKRQAKKPRVLRQQVCKYKLASCPLEICQLHLMHRSSVRKKLCGIRGERFDLTILFLGLRQPVELRFKLIH